MTPQAIIRETCRVYELTEHALRGPGRSQWAVEARMAAVVLLRETGLSLHNCGRLLRRDHSTILHLEIKAVRNAQAPHFAARLLAIRNALQVPA